MFVFGMRLEGFRLTVNGPDFSSVSECTDAGNSYTVCANAAASVGGLGVEQDPDAGDSASSIDPSRQGQA